MPLLPQLSFTNVGTPVIEMLMSDDLPSNVFVILVLLGDDAHYVVNRYTFDTLTLPERTVLTNQLFADACGGGGQGHKVLDLTTVRARARAMRIQAQEQRARTRAMLDQVQSFPVAV